MMRQPAMNIPITVCVFSGMEIRRYLWMKTAFVYERYFIYRKEL